MSASQRAMSPVIPIVGLVLGIALGLIAQFALDSLADTSATWHQIQHGTLFVGGILAGYGGTALYQFSRKRA